MSDVTTALSILNSDQAVNVLLLVALIAVGKLYLAKDKKLEEKNEQRVTDALAYKESMDASTRALEHAIEFINKQEK